MAGSDRSRDTPRRGRLTPKQRVLMHGTAVCWRAKDTGNWLVTAKECPFCRLGSGSTPQAAWAVAARNPSETRLRELLDTVRYSDFPHESDEAIEEISGMLSKSAARSDTVAAAPSSEIAPPSLVAWLQAWWKLSEEERAKRMLDYGPDVAHLLRGVADMIDGSAPSANAVARNDVLEEAARRIEKIGHDYMHEHGNYDSSTNAWEIHHKHAERIEALDDAVAAIRDLQAPAPDRSTDG